MFISGQRATVSGQRSAIGGQQSAVSGQPSAGSHRRAAVSWQRAAESRKPALAKPFIHDPKPQRENDAQHHHAGITGGHLWGIVCADEGLVFFVGFIMVV
jgi:hypothetical protein